ncbi:MAG TPA: hypothetical protein VFO60_09110 [Candidatus Dormibacteraeota bacterium]|nr:hypothetical protein [Candidatus Dormibacteraeota bacterium]
MAKCAAADATGAEKRDTLDDGFEEDEPALLLPPADAGGAALVAALAAAAAVGAAVGAGIGVALGPPRMTQRVPPRPEGQGVGAVASTTVRDCGAASTAVSRGAPAAIAAAAAALHASSARTVF